MIALMLADAATGATGDEHNLTIYTLALVAVTAFLVLATFGLMFATWWVGRSASKDSREQIAALHDTTAKQVKAMLESATNQIAASNESTTKQINAWHESTAKQNVALHESTLKEIGVTTWLEFIRRFDSAEMVNARSKFANALRSNENRPEQAGDVSELVLNFFEDLAIVYELDYINRTLAINSFSYYLARWWKVSQEYIIYERKRQGGNDTLFEKFQTLATGLVEENRFLSKDNIRIFLHDEANLFKLR